MAIRSIAQEVEKRNPDEEQDRHEKEQADGEPPHRPTVA